MSEPVVREVDRTCEKELDEREGPITGIVFSAAFFDRLWKDLGTVEGLDGYRYPLDMQSRTFRGVPMEIVFDDPADRGWFHVYSKGGWITRPGGRNP